MLTTTRLNELSNLQLVRMVFARDGELWDAWHSRDLKLAWEHLVADGRHSEVSFMEACGSPKPGSLRALMRLGGRIDYWGVSDEAVMRAAMALRCSFIPFKAQRSRLQSLAHMLHDLAYSPYSSLSELQFDPESDNGFQQCWTNCVGFMSMEEEFVTFWWGEMSVEDLNEAVDLYIGRVWDRYMDNKKRVKNAQD